MRPARPAAATIVTACLLAPVVTAAPPRPPGVFTVSVAGAAGPADVATGFAAGGERVVTVAHVLAGDGRRPVTVRGSDGVARAARVVRTDPRLDLAVLAVAGLRAPAARLARDGDELRVLVVRARRATTVDSPVRRRVRARVWGAPPAVRPALELEARVAAGDSGAPAVTAQGRVAGVVFARSTGRPRTTYAVDATGLRDLLSDNLKRDSPSLR
jgi:S1-C subfamily serine protease